MTVGANITLTRFAEILARLAKRGGYEYCAELEKHILKVANVPVRNVRGALVRRLK